MNWSSFNEIPNIFLEADSDKRVKWVYCDKGHNLPNTVFLPLYRKLTAKPISECPDVIIPTPVAVYKLDKDWGKHRPIDCYVYAGDDNR